MAQRPGRLDSHLPWQRSGPCFRNWSVKEKRMNSRTTLISFLLACTLFSFACVYVVLPEGLDTSDPGGGAAPGVGSAMVTNVTRSDAGDLHVDLTIRNNTGDWSTMQAIPDKPAVLKTG